MKSHVKSAHEKCSDFECEHCGKKLASVRRLRGHIYQCHSQVACELCQKVLSNSTELKRHIVFAHNQTGDVWICEKCPKGPRSVFFVKTMYEKHMKQKH